MIAQFGLPLIGLICLTWVTIDASKRDWSSSKFADSTVKWVIGMALLWIVVLPIYLVKRGKAPLKATA